MMRPVDRFLVSLAARISPPERSLASLARSLNQPSTHELQLPQTFRLSVQLPSGSRGRSLPHGELTMNLRLAVLATAALALTAIVSPASANPNPGDCLTMFGTNPPLCIPDVGSCDSEALLACQAPCLNEGQCVSSCADHALGEVVAGIPVCTSLNLCSNPFEAPDSDWNLSDCAEPCPAPQLGVMIEHRPACIGRLDPCRRGSRRRHSGLHEPQPVQQSLR